MTILFFLKFLEKYKKSVIYVNIMKKEINENYSDKSNDGLKNKLIDIAVDYAKKSIF